MKATVNGIQLFFDVEGAKVVPDGAAMREKPTLILLHGGPGVDHAGFKPGMSVLAEAAQIIYYDHRGHGRSDTSDPDHWNLDQWADDLVGLCTALEIEKPIVLGQSFGGYVAVNYATRYPDHPGKLIFSSCRAKSPDFERSLRVFERLGGPEARGIANNYFEDASAENFVEFRRVCGPLYNPTPADPDARTRSIATPKVLEHFRRGELLRLNYLAALARVVCPTLVLGGEDDPMIPIEDQADIAEALPAHLVQFHRIPTAGHGPFRDDPRVFDIIRDFILA